MNKTCAVIIPTYNELEELQKCLATLEFPEGLDIKVLIINAGDPISFPDRPYVEVIKVPSDHFWGTCIRVGFEEVIKRGGFDYVMLANADTTFLPGSIQGLFDYVKTHPRHIAVCPAYDLVDGKPVIHYSDQLQWGFLYYGKINRRWETLADAPKDPIEVELVGGQGVMFEADELAKFPMDDKRFPQAAGDHDLWVRFRQAGYKLMLIPTTGIVNERPLSQKRKKSLMATLWWRMTCKEQGESIFVMWNLRRKHLSLPSAVVSFLISFIGRWTVGLPKIIGRS